ncbi:MAG: Lrp/AsnC family transcriptional regulator [Candidatus Hydrogenedentota bacterium]
MRNLIKLLIKNAKIDTKDLAKRLHLRETEVKAELKKLQKDKVILGFKPVLDREKVYKDDYVSSAIEVKVTPQRDVGFDAIAQRIAKFSEVRSLYLVSGAYDLLVIVEGRNLKEVSTFVATKLATLDEVQSTSTHFMLKTYKEQGVAFESEIKPQRLKVSL